MINTILEMAKKRALLDVVLSATRSSDLFTLDMEYLKGMDPVNKSLPEEPIIKPQLAKLKLLGKDLGLSRADAEELLEKEYGVSNTQQLTKFQATKLI